MSGLSFFIIIKNGLFRQAGTALSLN